MAVFMLLRCSYTGYQQTA